MGDFEDRTSAFDRVIHHGADAWHRLDRAEAAGSKARSARNRSAAVRRNSRNGRTRTEVKVWPEVLKVALAQAGGDASRLRIVSDTEVWVM
ncbi:hypothetical protein [Streptomyces sp. NPDC058268]|jgi:hypothetical protein|uniref:hypothetical protein n=1 Tax=Streptomyces sp. NPDC058268 TaxID=3346413 RepID=UPI0036EC7F98